MTDEQNWREIAGKHGFVVNGHWWDEKGVIAAMSEAVAAERERCARICADMPIKYEREGHYHSTMPEDYAAAIRQAEVGTKA